MAISLVMLSRGLFGGALPGRGLTASGGEGGREGGRGRLIISDAAVFILVFYCCLY